MQLLILTQLRNMLCKNSSTECGVPLHSRATPRPVTYCIHHTYYVLLISESTTGYFILCDIPWAITVQDSPVPMNEVFNIHFLHHNLPVLSMAHPWRTLTHEQRCLQIALKLRGEARLRCTLARCTRAAAYHSASSVCLAAN